MPSPKSHEKQNSGKISVPREDSKPSLAKNVSGDREKTPFSLPSKDWMALIASMREATSSVTNSSSPTQHRDSGRRLMMEFVKHLTDVSQTVTVYTAALHRARNDEESLNEKGEVGAAPSQIDKNIILITRRALRFALSCLSFGRAYDESKNDDDGNDHHEEQTNMTTMIQEEAIIAHDCLLHRPLCQLISAQNTDGKCRLLAAKLLSNLVTSNAKTAAVLAADVECAPSDEIVTKRMLNVMKLSDTNNDKSNDEEDLLGLTWVDMISASAKAGDRETVAAVAAALHNCIVSLEVEYGDHKSEGNGDNMKGKGPFWCAPFAVSVATNTALVCNMLRHILPADAIKSSVKSSSSKQQMTLDEKKSSETIKVDDNDSHGGADAATEWISLVIERLCGLGLLPQMHHAVGGSSRNDDGNKKKDAGSDCNRRMPIVTPEQIVLLNCVWRSVEEQMHPTNMKSGLSSSPRHPLGGSVGENTIMTSSRFLAREVESTRSALKLIGDSSNGSQAKTTKAFQNEHYDGETACVQDAYMTMLEMLATSLSHDGEDSKNRDSASNGCIVAKVREHLGRESPLLKSALLDLGQLVDDLSTRNRGRKARELSMANEEQRLVVALVRLIGNLCFRCRYNQDLVRTTDVPVSRDVADSMTISKNSDGGEKAEIDSLNSTFFNEKTTRNGLHIILSCTSFSYGCFTLREWALVTIRNILEDNDENRDVVARLEAQKAVDTPELQKMGVKVDLDKRGKVHVVHDKNKESCTK